MTNPKKMLRHDEFPVEVVAWAAKITEAINAVGTSVTIENGMTYDLGDIEILYDGENVGIGIGGSEFSADQHAIISYVYKEVKE